MWRKKTANHYQTLRHLPSAGYYSSLTRRKAGASILKRRQKQTTIQRSSYCLQQTSLFLTHMSLALAMQKSKTRYLIPHCQKQQFGLHSHKRQS
jgi:hypothetical protein